MFKEYLKKCLNGGFLTESEAQLVMDSIMKGNVSQSQVASFLTILTYRGETVEEITGFVRALRENMRPFSTSFQDAVDTCGTGGDGASTFNISTASAIAASSLGVKVAKHGNRAVSSKSGSADVLEYLGIDIGLTEEAAKEKLEHYNMAFLFAPFYHPAMKNVASIRKELGFRTVFNALGPMANPANCLKQVIGVYSFELSQKLAKALQKLNPHHVLFVTGRDGLDEISACAKTDIVELKEGQISTYTIAPEDFGLQRGTQEEIVVKTAEESARLIQDIFANKAPTTAVNAVVLNTAAALYVSGKALSIEEGVRITEEAIKSKTVQQHFRHMTKEVNLHA
ncbi:anthranilate phosphoribosyltransferase [Priestia endophytica]|uniref:anthranilate phosphoribosyltransferase n=1 Tax=Priestia endophytica TaxID=135735 RepID=UPI000DCA6436|nr:anthranilate phosphoribosyltransferase [Priestia endophytica]RAS79758.1 anthranilate phosphoribosyltransferase [Priestia endophytica]